MNVIQIISIMQQIIQIHVVSKKSKNISKKRAMDYLMRSDRPRNERKQNIPL